VRIMCTLSAPKATISWKEINEQMLGCLESNLWISSSI
jgi:hypothetical protein